MYRKLNKTLKVILKKFKQHRKFLHQVEEELFTKEIDINTMGV